MGSATPSAGAYMAFSLQDAPWENQHLLAGQPAQKPTRIRPLHSLGWPKWVPLKGFPKL